MIHLHTGCKFSEPWDKAFQNILEQWQLPYKICDLKEPQKGSVFIGRINEFGLHLKDDYETRVKNFNRVWPEVLAMKLYDDKFLQAEFLAAYPTPKQKVANNQKDVEGFEFPVVCKKAKGSSSKNVTLAQKKSDLNFPCLLQEFCKNNDRDLRITVIGNQVMGFERMNRPNDFRASGSNNIVPLKNLPIEPARIAWKICKEHKFTTMAFDFLKLRGKWVIIEMSYTYVLNSIPDNCSFYMNMKNEQVIERKPDPAEMIMSELLKIKL